LLLCLLFASPQVLQAKLDKNEGRVRELEAVNRRYSDDTTNVDTRYRAAALNSQVVKEAAQPAFNTNQVRTPAATLIGYSRTQQADL
jgi:Tol biopolymer transport system component